MARPPHSSRFDHPNNIWWWVIGPRLCIVFRNMVIVYGEELLAPRPTPTLEDHPLSAVRDCIFAATLHIRGSFLHPQPEDAPCRGDRDPLFMGTKGMKQDTGI
jgi:hypothetical protein